MPTSKIVGSINFAAVITRPDVAFAASKLSEFLTNPSKCHSEAAIRTLKYLGHSKTLTIWFNSSDFFGNSDHSSSDQTIFLASSDASFADDPATRYSSQGYGFKLFSGMIDWKALWKEELGGVRGPLLLGVQENKQTREEQNNRIRAIARLITVSLAPRA